MQVVVRQIECFDEQPYSVKRRLVIVGAVFSFVGRHCRHVAQSNNVHHLFSS